MRQHCVTHTLPCAAARELMIPVRAKKIAILFAFGISGLFPFCFFFSECGRGVGNEMILPARS